MTAEIIYIMNIAIAGFKKGDWWIKGTEPLVVTKWAEQGGGIYGTNSDTIITIEARDPIELGENKAEFTGVCPKCGYNDKKEVIPELSPKKNEINNDRICKGVKTDGSPCVFSGNRVRENGYCFMHQDQAPKEEKPPDEEPTVDAKKEESQEDESHDTEVEVFKLINDTGEGES